MNLKINKKLMLDQDYAVLQKDKYNKYIGLIGAILM